MFYLHYKRFFFIRQLRMSILVIIWLFVYICKKRTKKVDYVDYVCQVIPLSAIRDLTISRFHPIAQKQKTDLNIPPGLVSAGHVTAKTKAGRKSGCQIDPGHAVWGERGSQAAGNRQHNRHHQPTLTTGQRNIIFQHYTVLASST